MARDLDLGSGHTAYRRASLIYLYQHTKFHSNRRNFVDGRTDGRTDGHFSPLILLGRLLEVDLKTASRLLITTTITTATATTSSSSSSSCSF